ncbi:hypothetical protein NBRC116188_07750 [Oceaniserpentilla sp. 4NH20-0058]|uniref:copper chaperone PCu(A)C n=1 Tax=Oceaniserpentilla sp. 4NH20-0058 TaxID=3127660 RepID=UPI00310226AC
MGRFFLASMLLFVMNANAELLMHDAQVRAMPPGQPNTAAFMVLQNTGTQAITLVSASTSMAKDAQYHTHIKKASGVMSMQQVSNIVIPAGASFVFESGAHHIMLLGLKQPLIPGDQVDLQLKDEQGKLYTYDVPVKSMMGNGHMHHHHHGKE